MGLDMYFQVPMVVFDNISQHRNSWLLWQWFVDNGNLDPDDYYEHELSPEIINRFLKQSEEVLISNSKEKIHINNAKAKKYFPLRDRASLEKYNEFFIEDLISLRKGILSKLAEDPNTKFYISYNY